MRYSASLKGYLEFFYTVVFEVAPAELEHEFTVGVLKSTQLIIVAIKQGTGSEIQASSNRCWNRQRIPILDGVAAVIRSFRLELKRRDLLALANRIAERSWIGLGRGFGAQRVLDLRIAVRDVVM